MAISMRNIRLLRACRQHVITTHAVSCGSMQSRPLQFLFNFPRSSRCHASFNVDPGPACAMPRPQLLSMRWHAKPLRGWLTEQCSQYSDAMIGQRAGSQTQEVYCTYPRRRPSCAGHRLARHAPCCRIAPVSKRQHSDSERRMAAVKLLTACRCCDIQICYRLRALASTGLALDLHWPYGSMHSMPEAQGDDIDRGVRCHGMPSWHCHRQRHFASHSHILGAPAGDHCSTPY